MKIIYCKDQTFLTNKQISLYCEGLKHLCTDWRANIGAYDCTSFYFYGTLGFIAFYESAGHLWVHRAYVQKKYRRKKVFTTLMERLHKDYPDREIRLNTFSENTDMQSALASLGYKQRLIEYTNKM